MVHVLHNIAFTAADVASKVVNFSKRKLLKIASTVMEKLLDQVTSKRFSSE